MKFQIGKRLKKYGIKQTWFAEMLGVDKNQVTRWVKGHQEPSPNNLKKIKIILDKFKRMDKVKDLE